ncbi:uncharacterized protein LOC122654155 [Telopea speciosissima]|uniref:uncharacterized protein LOC122654155 n=1 Tax=Telopea speciosissima TaxID=54955 RepID=UPI001CC74291|nr:uncharacterized protein LOC122654155 [Telopea speciosissima]
MREMGLRGCLRDTVPFAAMVAVECTNVGLNTLSKAAMSRGMNTFVFLTYCYGLATLFILPPAFISHRRVNRPITFSILCKLLLLGLLGYSGQIFSYTGIRYSSPTLSAAISNLVPVFTFVLAVIFRMEKLELRRSSSQAKSIGAVVSIAGAFVVTLYRGQTILMTLSTSPDHHLLLTTSPSNWVIGGLCIATSSMLFAFWYILQATIVKEYPDEVTVTCIYSFIVTIESAIVSLSTERNPSSWSLKPGLELITIFYSAVFGPTFSTAIHTWCIHKRGPVYAAMFRPLGIVIAVFMGVLFLGDTLHLGSMFGSMIIILGFYGVMWGKSEENKLVDDEGINGHVSSAQNEPLLPKERRDRQSPLKKETNPCPFIFCPPTSQAERLRKGEMVWNLNMRLNLKKNGRGVMPFAGMVMVECLDVGMTTLSKAAMSRGMSHYVFVFYSNALATLILLPLSFLLFPRSNRPPLTFSLICRFFLLGLVGITLMQNCVFTGINLSSPTLGSALSNLVPAFTFILAVICRVEKVDFRSSGSQLRILGSVVSISGALVVILNKGPSIGTTQSSPPSHNIPASSNTNYLVASNWVLGGLFLGAASFSISIWHTLQAATLKKYPVEMIVVSFNSFFGTIQCAIVALILERNPTAWTLKPDLELLSIFYSAVIGSVVTPCVLTWCIHEKGPVFVAMFKPLGIAIAALMGSMFLGDTLYLGSVVGAIIIVIGFHGVIWGQSKEEKRITKAEDDDDAGIESSVVSIEKAPLLQKYREV